MPRLPCDQVLWALKSNPPVIAAVAGVVFNLSQRIIGSTVDGRPQLPWYISVVVSMAGQAFTPLVLFIAGLGTRGSIGSLGSLRGVILPTALVVFKSLILPVVAYGCVFLLGGNEEARDYAFAYGLLPVANAIFAISRRRLPRRTRPRLRSWSIAVKLTPASSDCVTPQLWHRRSADDSSCRVAFPRQSDVVHPFAIARSSLSVRLCFKPDAVGVRCAFQWHAYGLSRQCAMPKL